MRNAYALLGISFLIVFTGAYVLLSDKAHAPTQEEMPLPDNQSSDMSLQLFSPVFENNATIPSKYTCDGENVNPPLSIQNIPNGTKSLVLVMDDPDIPQEIKESRGIEKFDHWVVYNIPFDTTEILEGQGVGIPGNNSAGNASYTGPCPPPQYQPTEHRYVFRLYALSGTLNFIKEPSLDEVEKAAQGMVLEQAELVGRYDRSAND